MLIANLQYHVNFNWSSLLYIEGEYHEFIEGIQKEVFKK